MTREQMIATLSLLGWEAQWTLVVHRGSGLATGGTFKIHRNYLIREAWPEDGWFHFSDEVIAGMFHVITEKP